MEQVLNLLPVMVAHVFHIGLIDFLLLGVMFTTLVFALLLGFIKVGDRNRFLALALLVTALSVAGFLGWVPLGFAAALGPLVYFFARGVTGKRSRLEWRDGWHVVPVAAGFFSLVAVFVFVGLYLLFAVRLFRRYYDGLVFTEGERERSSLWWLERPLRQLAWSSSAMAFSRS